MKEGLSNFLRRNFPFNKDGIDEFLDSFKLESYVKGTTILRPNSIDRKLKYVQSGYIREYYASDSKEVNINFYGNGQFATDLSSFVSSRTTQKWQQCLTEVELLCVHKSLFEELLLKYECAHSIIQHSFQKLLDHKESIEHSNITKSKEEIYLEIQSNKPDWLNHIPQYHIASYLNMTPESLSRMRKRIY